MNRSDNIHIMSMRTHDYQLSAKLFGRPQLNERLLYLKKTKPKKRRPKRVMPGNALKLSVLTMEKTVLV